MNTLLEWLLSPGNIYIVVFALFVLAVFFERGNGPAEW